MAGSIIHTEGLIFQRDKTSVCLWFSRGS